MKKRMSSFVLLLIVILVVGIPTAHAYMVKRTTTVTNVFKPAQVSCEVVENGFNNVTKPSVIVKNTSDISAYIRLRVLTYWEDSKGNIVARNAPNLTINYNKQEWIKDDANNTYYCKTEIASKANTPEFLMNSITLKPVVEEATVGGVKVYYTYYPVVEIIAEAIQSKPASAVTDSWKVTVDSNGTITKVN